jgi:hypothetical protein
MKLGAAQISHVERQLGFQSVPDDHPVMSDLKDTFGDHTFFLDTKGLNIVEFDTAADGTSGIIFKLASWANEDQSELLPHDPEIRSAAVDLVPGKPDPAA